jgi:60 kDa SS-A/Ro ribonucleoprotein
MANKNLFKSTAGVVNVPATNAINAAGGRAYQSSDKQALAQYAATGMFGDSFYTSAEKQLEVALRLANAVPADYLAKVAVYSREKGFLKDMPAVLLAVLASRGEEGVALLKKVFNRVLDNGKMVRNFVQVIRSGAAGRKSLGNAPKKLIQNWIANRSDEKLFADSVGNSPSLADVIKMVHPKGSSAKRAALYGYICGKTVVSNQKSVEFRSVEAGGKNFKVRESVLLSDLPECVQEFEKFKTEKGENIPDVPFQMLTALELGEKEWTQIAMNAPWHMARMNLNTFARHGVLKNEKVVDKLAATLTNAETIKKVKVFPYQLLMAYKAVESDSAIPSKLKNALQDALDVAVDAAPVFSGKVHIGVDTSGSMSGASVTGNRGSATSAARCIDVAGLIASMVLRKNTDASLYPFDTEVHALSGVNRRGEKYSLNPRDSVMTNAMKLAAFGGGGTDCSAPLKEINKAKKHVDIYICVSDNESWVENGSSYRGNGTGVASEWELVRKRCPNAKMININLAVEDTVQILDAKGIINVGGFSSEIFEVIKLWTENGYSADGWVKQIEAIQL